ncbi:uncharacterized protein [Penaeus vannamei]|uniref:uncharacterized protein n=1 Tax=Penaeus vannamei TaxID=6689 RepID=UPI00387F7922
MHAKKLEKYGTVYSCLNTSKLDYKTSDLSLVSSIPSEQTLGNSPCPSTNKLHPAHSYLMSHSSNLPLIPYMQSSRCDVTAYKTREVTPVMTSVNQRKRSKTSLHRTWVSVRGNDGNGDGDKIGDRNGNGGDCDGDKSGNGGDGDGDEKGVGGDCDGDKSGNGGDGDGDKME